MARALRCLKRHEQLLIRLRTHTAAADPARSHLRSAVGWPGCIFIDLPHRKICAALVMAPHPALGHYKCVEPDLSSCTSSSGIGVAVWECAGNHYLPLCTRLRCRATPADQVVCLRLAVGMFLGAISTALLVEVPTD